MPPKLRVLATNARHEQRLKNEISSGLASIIQSNSKMTPKEAMWSITHELLANNPYQPPANGKCPINDLPDEILGYIFSVGVKEEEEEELEGSDSEADEEDDGWEDMDSDDEATDKDEEGPTAVIDVEPNPFDSDSEYGSQDSDMFSADDEPRIPFQVLVSHICKRWREVALDSHVLWTTLSFRKRPRLEKARMYIQRARELPLNIYIDCTFPEDVDEEDHPDHPLYLENKALNKAVSSDAHFESHDDDQMDVDPDEQEEMRFLSQKELSQILDLVAPEVSHWRVFDFRASTYGYVHMVLSRLHSLPSAPLLEDFEVIHFEDCDDYEFFSGDDKTAFLPFHGNAPLLKAAAFWGVHIDWEGAVPNFLSGLKELELSFHAKDVRPSYSAFAQMIAKSPELQTLTLSLSGPALPDAVAFDAEIEDGGWGPTPLTIPSLKEFAMQFHDIKYASALVQHLDMPNVTGLLLNFDEEDYSSFVRALLKPVKGRTESLLQNIDHLKIAGLPCDVASLEALLGQLTKLTNLNLKVVGEEEAVIFQKLIKPAASRPGTTTTSEAPATAAPVFAAVHQSPGAFGPLPAVFCPRLESVTTNQVTGGQLKELVTARRALGVPLKRICMSHDDPVTKKEEKWLRENVEELDFFEPSDSEDEIDDMLYIETDDEEEEDEDHHDHDDDEDGEGGEGMTSPMLSPLARHLGRGRGPRQHRGTDLD